VRNKKQGVESIGNAHSTDAAKLSRVPKLLTPEFPTNTVVPEDDPHEPLIFLLAAATHRENVTRSLREHQAVVGRGIRLNAGDLTDESRIRDISAPALRQVHVQAKPSKVCVSAQGAVEFVIGRDLANTRYIHAA
jgi:hypothetical protein